jgi:hypothetical protein
LQIHRYFIDPSSPLNTTLVETHQVSQLSIKNGLENINSFDEEACTSQIKYHVPFSPQETHLEAFPTRKFFNTSFSIKIEYTSFKIIFQICSHNMCI